MPVASSWQPFTKAPRGAGQSVSLRPRRAGHPWPADFGGGTTGTTAPGSGVAYPSRSSGAEAATARMSAQARSSAICSAWVTDSGTVLRDLVQQVVGGQGRAAR